MVLNYFYWSKINITYTITPNSRRAIISTALKKSGEKEERGVVLHPRWPNESSTVHCTHCSNGGKLKSKLRASWLKGCPPPLEPRYEIARDLRSIPSGDRGTRMTSRRNRSPWKASLVFPTPQIPFTRLANRRRRGSGKRRGQKKNRRRRKKRKRKKRKRRAI